MSTPKEVRERYRVVLHATNGFPVMTVVASELASLLDYADDRDALKMRTESAESERGRLCRELEDWRRHATHLRAQLEQANAAREGMAEALREVGRALGRDTKGVYRVIAEEMASIARAALAKYGATS